MADRRKIILITGVSAGIGEAFVRFVTASKPDYHIVGLGRTSITAFEHPSYSFIATDLNNLNEIDRACAEVHRKFGTVDILINNAGFAYTAAIEDISPPELSQQIHVNLTAPIYLMQKVLPGMREQKGGHIINVSSIATEAITPTLGIYAATKSALLKVSEVLREEVRSWHITVSVFSPGSVKSSFGKHMQKTTAAQQSAYSELYASWSRRYKNFFTNFATSEEAAHELWYTVEQPQDNYFFQRRDRFIVMLKKILPYRFFRYLLFRDFYKESLALNGNNTKA